MSNQQLNPNGKLMETPSVFEVNGEDVKLTGNTVKNYLVRGNADVTDQEVVMFINLCKYQKLNPFINEAYLVKFKGSPAQIIVGKDAFMRRAENNEQFAGVRAGIIVERDGEMVDIEGAIKLPNDKLLGGWAIVYRKDRETTTPIRISFDEFSKGQSTWKSMPMTMIRKTAIVNALREAFPNSLGNMYTDEETPDTTETVAREINENANSEIIDVDFKEPVEDPVQHQEPSEIKQREEPELQPSNEHDEKPSALNEEPPF
ncbi:phage recombination protein Bet [Bacillus sp. FSL W7-1085]|uniref:phage recombination protein Bet n=1 Tax=Bacillus sp. FSL W7-1085 TaxID=2921694 RepID=UPI00315AC267